MTNKWGLGLANADNRPDLDRIAALGCGWYLALHQQLEDLTALLALRPDARGIIRFHRRDLLSRPIAEVLADIRPVWADMQRAGIRDLILGNEFNNRVEGRVYPPDEMARRYRALLEQVRPACPGVRLHLPGFSPPLEGATYYLACRDQGLHDLVEVVDVHAYGDSPDALAWVDLVGDVSPRKTLACTEYNFAAGRAVDPDWYAQDAVRFFRGIEERERVESACLFVWFWQNPDSDLRTTVDVRDQPLERALREAAKVDRPSKDYPGATWLPSQNFGYPQGTPGRGGHEVVAVIDHIAEGSRAGLESHFLNPNSEASSTYAVYRDGVVTQFVREADAPWTNGIDFAKGYGAYGSDLSIPWLRDCWSRQVNPNLVTVTIEHEGRSGTPLSELQYQATLALHRHLVERYQIPVDRQHLVGHSAIDGMTRERDPGPAFPWLRLIADLQPKPPLNVGELSTLPNWYLACLQAGEDYREKSRADFAAHVRATGGDPNRLRDYGWRDSRSR